MAIKLTNKPNTSPVSGDYAYGDIRDRAGVTPGTPVSREVYADFHQFFERLMALGSVAHNNLPDNNTNGFQLIEALSNYMLSNVGYKRYYVQFQQSGTSAPTLNYIAKNELSTSSTWTYIGVGEYQYQLPVGATDFAEPEKVFSSGILPQAGGFLWVEVRDQRTIRIHTYNRSGVKTNGLLQDSFVKIEIWP